MPPFCGNNTLQQILNLMSAKLTVLADKDVDLTPILDSLTTIDGDTSGLATIINAVQSSVNSTNQSLGTITTNTASALTKLNTIDGNTSGLATAVNGVQSSVNSANTSLGTITTNTASALTKLNTIDGNTSGLATAVNGVQSSVNSANTSLGTITTNTASALTKLDAIKAVVDSLSTGGGTLKVAYIWDEKAINIVGGTFTSGAWRQRDLNTKLDPDNLVSVASNQITLLNSGKYTIRATALAGYGTYYHQARLLKNGTQIALGTSEDSINTHQISHSHVLWTGTITANDIIKLEHYCYATVASYGFGISNTWGPNVYSQVEIIQFT